MPGPQLPNHEKGGQQIEVSPHRGLGNAQRSGGIRRFPDLPVIMGEHRPEAEQRGGRDRDAELRQVPFKERPDETPPPCPAILLSAGQGRPGKSSPFPVAGQRLRAPFGGTEPGNKKGLPSSPERFGRLPEKIGGSAPKNEE